MTGEPLAFWIINGLFIVALTVLGAVAKMMYSQLLQKVEQLQQTLNKLNETIARQEEINRTIFKTFDRLEASVYEQMTKMDETDATISKIRTLHFANHKESL